MISGEHQEGEEGKPTNEVCSGDVTMPTAPVTTPTAPVTTPTAPVTAPQSTDVPEVCVCVKCVYVSVPVCI